ncbi:MAG: hypothetical protein RL653_2728 [Pseudomonadota bacterium]|jgi:hypothetical protein
MDFGKDGRWTLLEETRPGRMHLRCSATGTGGWLYLAVMGPATLLIGINEVTNRARPLSTDQKVFGSLIAVAVGIFFLSLLINRVHISVDCYELVMKSGPVPWWSEARFDLYGVTRVEVIPAAPITFGSKRQRHRRPAMLVLHNGSGEVSRFAVGPFSDSDIERAAAHLRTALPFAPDGTRRELAA